MRVRTAIAGAIAAVSLTAVPVTIAVTSAVPVASAPAPGIVYHG